MAILLRGCVCHHYKQEMNCILIIIINYISGQLIDHKPNTSMHVLYMNLFNHYQVPNLVPALECRSQVLACRFGSVRYMNLI